MMFHGHIIDWYPALVKSAHFTATFGMWIQKICMWILHNRALIVPICTTYFSLFLNFVTDQQSNYNYDSSVCITDFVRTISLFWNRFHWSHLQNCFRYASVLLLSKSVLLQKDNLLPSVLVNDHCSWYDYDCGGGGGGGGVRMTMVTMLTMMMVTTATMTMTRNVMTIATAASEMLWVLLLSETFHKNLITTVWVKW